MRILKPYILSIFLAASFAACDSEPKSDDKGSDDHHDDDCDFTALHGGEEGGDGVDCDDLEGITDEERQQKEDEIDEKFPDPQLSDCATDEEEFSGNIAADTTWDQAIKLTADATVAAGATLTISGCGKVTAVSGAHLFVDGTLKIVGKADQVIGLDVDDDTERWGGIRIQSGGSLDANHAFVQHADRGFGCETGAVDCTIKNSTIKSSPFPIHFAGPGLVDSTIMAGMENKGVFIDSGADLTINNSQLYKPISGDVLAQSGGDLKITKSEIGGTDYEHCAIHITAGDSLLVEDTILTANAYAIMLGNIDGAIFRHNNFMESDTKHFLKIGSHTNTELDNNYWEGGAQDISSSDFTGTSSTITNTSATEFDDIGSSL